MSPEYRGTVFVEVESQQLTLSGPNSWVSPQIQLPILADQLILSWNAIISQQTGITLEIRAFCHDHWTSYYTAAHWSPSPQYFPRQSVAGQQGNDGMMDTDILRLHKPASKAQLRLTYRGVIPPQWTFLALCATDTQASFDELPPCAKAWGRELVVPEKTQLGWEGGTGWCSPTSTAMVLAYWAKKLHRSDLTYDVPEVAAAVYDPTWNGTGNWSFNTAFAGAHAGIRAYVTRFSDIYELEQWILAGVPPIVSVSYDLLKGKAEAHDAGHLMVCIGFTKTGDPVFKDPYYRPEHGETCRRVFPRINFLRAWNHSHKTVYLIYPSDHSIPQTTYHHWARSAKC
ncbi:C39 family peptidase [Chthonomonas calidirosea]|uniref:C39 family peptidase n=1 Tax=Chthonomonas calidirosea TaxID=454171 RepID=UPI0006ECAB4F|nr:C39 family peptidase [Chthonomonas calidirosea]CEK14310.1 Peptidase_C39 like family [Chthonomonas calidirosea]